MRKQIPDRKALSSTFDEDGSPLIDLDTFRRAVGLAAQELKDAAGAAVGRLGKFAQVQGGLRGISLGSGGKVGTTQGDKTTHKKLDAVVAAVAKAGTEPVLIRWAT